MNQQPGSAALTIHGGRNREIPTLHGLRALSIGVVLLSHAAMMPGVASTTALHGYGQFGVLVFFVISGYLITTLLSAEMEQRGSVSLRRFYLRRTLRIVPAYLAYLIGVLALISFGRTVAADARWWPALTYTSNFFSTDTWDTAHTWSLSVEEQFYVSWPILFVMLGRRRALWAALGALVAIPIVRVAMYLMTHDAYLTSLVNHDFIAAGCALALLAPRLQGRIGGFVIRWGWIAGILSVVAYEIFFGDGRWIFAARITVGAGVTAVLLAIGIIWCVANAQSPVGRFLDWGPIRAVGILSYSIYLWQQIFLGPTPLLPPEWSFIGVAVMALASYYVIERPALSLKRRFERYLIVAIPEAESDDSPAAAPVHRAAET